MDYILRATAGGGSFRIFIANTKNTVNEAFSVHKTSPVMSAMLGRMLTMASIMGCTLKSDSDLVTLKINGDGEGKGIVVTANNKVQVKGYPLNAMVDIPLKNNGKLDVSSAIGNGKLTVIKDLGLKEPYHSQMPIVSGEIAEDFTYYFAKSEQIPSSVALGVLVDRDYTIKQAGGFLIQVLPFADDSMIDKLEKKLKGMASFTSLLEENKSIEQILDELFGEFGVKILDKIDVNFYCNCSKKRVEKALLSVGKDELESILKEDKSANLHCHFCNKDYNFSEDELKKMLEEIV